MDDKTRMEAANPYEDHGNATVNVDGDVGAFEDVFNEGYTAACNDRDNQIELLAHGNKMHVLEIQNKTNRIAELEAERDQLQEALAYARGQVHTYIVPVLGRLPLDVIDQALTHRESKEIK